MVWIVEVTGDVSLGLLNIFSGHAVLIPELYFLSLIRLTK
jgi:hypothetical protein